MNRNLIGHHSSKNTHDRSENTSDDIEQTKRLHLVLLLLFPNLPCGSPLSLLKLSNFGVDLGIDGCDTFCHRIDEGYSDVHQQPLIQKEFKARLDEEDGDTNENIETAGQEDVRLDSVPERVEGVTDPAVDRLAAPGNALLHV